LLCGFIVPAAAQSAANNPASVSVPPVIQFSNVALDEGGTPLSGAVPITFALYNSSVGGQALWSETQNVHLGSAGQYSVYLGLTQANGLPTNLFSSGQAQWLGVKIESQPEQSRVYLVSVPYAMKAGDAATVGGLPASAFVLAAPSSSAVTSASSESAAVTNSSASPATSSDVTTSGGTAGFIPLWDATTDIDSSVISQSGTGSTAKVGINNATPAATLDVKGTATLRGTTTVLGTLTLPSTGAATAAAGKTSEPDTHVASAFNSSTSAAVNQTFQWQAEPIDNDTSMASGTLNLLFGQGTVKPAETGLHVASNGQITFATGQTFPGTGDGTITGVTAGTGLSGGGSSGDVSLSLASNGCAAGNAVTALPFTCSPFATLSANTFTGNQTVDGNLSATGVVTGASYQIGSHLFAFGSYANANAFLGFAGNSTMTGQLNTASGAYALHSNTTGATNTASGADVLNSNTTGSQNDAFGFEALFLNTTGITNDAFGFQALYSNTASGNDAFGYQALWSNATGSPNDAFGYQALYSNTTGSPNDAFGYQALHSNTLGGYNVGIGYGALYSNVGDTAHDGWYNTAVGSETLYMNSGTGGAGGYYNVAAGFQALYSNTNGSGNTAVGNGALFSNTNGSGNTAVGNGALFYNTTGSSSAFGTNALISNTTGTSNDAFGDSALYDNTTGGYNVALGDGALFYNTTGNYNTAVGNDACDSDTTGSNNTCLGYQSTPSDDGLTNATAIGAHAVVGQSNSLVLGGTGQYAVKVGIGTTTPSNILTVGRGAGHPVSDSWETYSSRRWKTNIQTLPDALGKVEQLRGVSYDLKDSGKHEIGVIAEEVGRVVPEVVSYEKNGRDATGVDYSRLAALLIEAVKQQQQEISALQRKLQRRAAKEAALESRLERLEQDRGQAQMAAARPVQ
jgi:hypothetical protein